MVMISTTTIDTIDVNDDETTNLLNNIQLYTEKGRKEYIKQIENIDQDYYDRMPILQQGRPFYKCF